MERKYQSTTQRPRGKDKGETKSRYIPKRKVCSFCANKVKIIDYKDTMKLNAYISNRGKMEPRRRTGVCAKHQRLLSTAIKRARHLALLPFSPEHIYRIGSAVPTAT